jgi:hypothetical protein
MTVRPSDSRTVGRVNIEVHREVGPGLLESVYKQALMFELANQDIRGRHCKEIKPSLPLGGEHQEHRVFKSGSFFPRASVSPP